MSIILAIMIALAVWLQSTSSVRFAIGRPDHAAETLINPERAKVAVALNVSSPIGAAEYDRRLTVTNGQGARTSLDLAPDHGGFAPVSVYRREDGTIAIASSLDGLLLLDLGRTPTIRRDNRPRRIDSAPICGSFKPAESNRVQEGLAESKYLPGYFYIGRFDFRTRGVWTFVPASERGEYLRQTGVGDFWDPGCP